MGYLWLPLTLTRQKPLQIQHFYSTHVFLYENSFYKNHEAQILWKIFTKNNETWFILKQVTTSYHMKVYTKKSILSMYFWGLVVGKIEKFGLKIKTLQGSEKNVWWDSHTKKNVPSNKKPWSQKRENVGPLFPKLWDCFQNVVEHFHGNGETWTGRFFFTG